VLLGSNIIAGFVPAKSDGVIVITASTSCAFICKILSTCCAGTLGSACSIIQPSGKLCSLVLVLKTLALTSFSPALPQLIFPHWICVPLLIVLLSILPLVFNAKF
jgi:hypothetical protein